MSINLLINRQDRILRITLNRPEKRNALSFELCHELILALDEAARDSGIAVVLLDASGTSFCAGMDLDEVLAPDAAKHGAVHEELFTIGSRYPKPIVAAVQGAALGGGTGLVANAHVVVAAEDARFGLTEIRLALWPFVVFRSVAHALGERRALELGLTGRIFPAADALQWGLVHYVTPAEQLQEKAREVAGLVASYSPTALGRGLAFVQDTRGLSWKQTGELAAEYRADAFQSPDFAEGVRAFLLKRKPKWQ
jgi:enoyl-CoA hydratase/carnithine racemase